VILGHGAATVTTSARTPQSAVLTAVCQCDQSAWRNSYRGSWPLQQDEYRTHQYAASHRERGWCYPSDM